MNVHAPAVHRIHRENVKKAHNEMRTTKMHTAQAAPPCGEREKHTEAGLPP